jgi:sugar/nucleoside kinase (ribokinase family)
MKVYGTGGIGTGIFFNLIGEHTIGRDESRLGYLTDYKDYCKCHIILHYIKVLSDCEVYPIGKIGNDTQGNELLTMMKNIGIKTDYIEKSDTAKTMYAICFQYPDGSGGNITTSNSACNEVTKEYVNKFNYEMDNDTIVLAMPEVPLESRIELLKLGRKNGSFNVASYLSIEAQSFINSDGLMLTDLLSINIDEAKSTLNYEIGSKKEIATKTIEYIKSINTSIKIIITAGKDGAYIWNGVKITNVPIIDVPVVSTAGCGDALIAGTIVGLINKKTLIESVEFGTKVSTLAVQSVDTISKKVDRSLIDEL